jgi:hypothetical protein
MCFFFLSFFLSFFPFLLALYLCVCTVPQPVVATSVGFWTE